MWDSQFSGRAAVSPAGGGEEELCHQSALHLLTHSVGRSLQEEVGDYHLYRELRVRQGRQGDEDVA